MIIASLDVKSIQYQKLNPLEGKLQQLRRNIPWTRAVDQELFRPELRNTELRKRFLGRYEDHDALLLSIGRLSAEIQIKRIHFVLKARPDKRLTLVGDSLHRQPLEKHLEGTATAFVGYLPGEELAVAYASGDAFLFPFSAEILGLVLLETMATDRPMDRATRTKIRGNHN